MFRVVKFIVVIAVLGTLLRWYGQHHAQDKISQLVRERSAQLPMTLAPTVKLTGLEFSNHVLRSTLEFSEKQDFGLRRAAAEKMMLDQYCRGDLKPFADAGVTAEYIVNYRTELGIPSTATITLQPGKCV